MWDLKKQVHSYLLSSLYNFVVSFAILCNRLIKIKEWVDKNDPGAVLIPFSGVFENKILDMDEAERAKYFEEHKVTRSVSSRSVITIINFYPLKCCCVALANKGVWPRVVYRRLKT